MTQLTHGERFICFLFDELTSKPSNSSETHTDVEAILKTCETTKTSINKKFISTPTNIPGCVAMGSVHELLKDNTQYQKIIAGTIASGQVLFNQDPIPKVVEINLIPIDTKFDSPSNGRTYVVRRVKNDALLFHFDARNPDLPLKDSITGYMEDIKSKIWLTKKERCDHITLFIVRNDRVRTYEGDMFTVEDKDFVWIITPGFVYVMFNTPVLPGELPELLGMNYRTYQGYENSLIKVDTVEDTRVSMTTKLSECSTVQGRVKYLVDFYKKEPEMIDMCYWFRVNEEYWYSYNSTLFLLKPARVGWISYHSGFERSGIYVRTPEWGYMEIISEYDQDGNMISKDKENPFENEDTDNDESDEEEIEDDEEDPFEIYLGVFSSVKLSIIFPDMEYVFLKNQHIYYYRGLPANHFGITVYSIEDEADKKATLRRLKSGEPVYFDMEDHGDEFTRTYLQ